MTARVIISAHATTADVVEAAVALAERHAAETRRESVTRMIVDGVDPDDIEAYEKSFDASVANWRLTARDEIRAILTREPKR